MTLKATDTVSGVQSLSYQLDGGTWLVYASPISVSGAGAHRVTFAAVDKAGNAEVAKVVEVRIAGTDVTAPQLSVGTSPITPHAVRYYATDNAGNTSATKTASVTVR